MARADPQLKLRLTEEMKDRLVTTARANNRSVNAEIVARLELSFVAEKFGLDDEKLITRTVDTLANVVKDMRHQNEVTKWMREQQRAANGIIEYIVQKDGNLDPEFVQQLRKVVESKGSDTGFPVHPDDKK